MKELTYVWLLFVALYGSLVGSEKVLIFTYSYNRPDFIEIQYRTFKKFVKDPYEFVVFNDATTPSMKHQICEMCSKLSIRCINIPQRIHDQPYLPRAAGEDFYAPSVRNCNVVQYSLNTLGFRHDGIVALFDSDLFLIKEFSFKDYLQGYGLAGLAQCRSNDTITLPYLWIGLAFLDFEKMPNKTSLNFNCGLIENIFVDAGGHTYYYLKNNPDVPVRYFGVRHIDSSTPCSMCGLMSCLHAHYFQEDSELQNMGFDQNQITLMRKGFSNAEFLADRTFLHYRSGTNWDRRSVEFHQKKSVLLNEYIEQILSE